MQIQKKVRRAYILVTEITYRELERNDAHPNSGCQTVDSMIQGSGGL